MAETGAAMWRAVDALDRAAAGFGLAAGLSGTTAKGWEMAENAFARAGHSRWRRTARERSGGARKMAATLSARAERSRQAAGALGMAHGMEGYAAGAMWQKPAHIHPSALIMQSTLMHSIP